MAPYRNAPLYLDLLSIYDRKTCSVPSSWNPDDKCTLLALSSNRLRVEYLGEGKCDAEAASIRADHAIPPQMGVFYYEIKILCKGKDGLIAMGVSSEKVSLVRLPGWDLHSYGYHGDDGHLFVASGSGKSFGPCYSTNDVVGCGANTYTGELFYTKNGALVGHSIKIDFSAIKYHPTIGMRSNGLLIETNFGQEPFSFDIRAYIKQKLCIYEETLNNANFKRPQKESLESLVLSYLLHEGYTQTALDFFRNAKCTSDQSRPEAARILPLRGSLCAIKSPSIDTEGDLMKEIKVVQQRSYLSDLILKGELNEAHRLMQSIHPALFQSHPKINFKIKGQIFIEMIRNYYLQRHQDAPSMNRDHDVDSILKYGHDLGIEAKGDTDSTAYLNQLYSIFTEPDPFSSPLSYYFDTKRRESLACEVLSSVITFENKMSMSAFETFIRQIAVVLSEASSMGLAFPAFINLRKDFLDTPEGKDSAIL